MKDYEHTLSKEELEGILKRNKQVRRILQEKAKQKAKEAELKQKTKEEKMEKKEEPGIWKKVGIGAVVIAAVTAASYFMFKEI